MYQLSAKELYEHLFRVISSQRFLQKQGLGNEIPFFICPYSPNSHVEMEQTRKQLISHLRQNGIIILDINLYDMSIDLLRGRGIWSKIIKSEASLDKIALKELLRNVLDVETHLIPEIATKIQNSEYHVMFLSGIGEIFPYIRSHTVLNNLQSTAKHQPTDVRRQGKWDRKGRKLRETLPGIIAMKSCG
jgi:hypothetical protein